MDSKYALKNLLLTLIGLGLGFGCSSSDTIGHMDVGPRGGSFDSGQQDIVDGSVQQDAGTDLSALEDLSFSDTSQRAPAVLNHDDRELSEDALWECSCPHPDDACNSSAICVRADRFCESDDECPDSYECNDSLCGCRAGSDSFNDSCKPQCTVDAHCPLYWGCLVLSGVCNIIAESKCRVDIDCPRGEVCHHFEHADRPRRYCAVPGPVAAGAPCDTGWECSTGRCRDGACEASCRVNSDCPENIACSPIGFCLGTRRCDDGQVYVRATGSCERSLCASSGDCGTGDCILASPDWLELGYCESESPLEPCKPGEVAISAHPDKCVLAGTGNCNLNSSNLCSSPYECWGSTITGFTGCARDR